MSDREIVKLVIAGDENFEQCLYIDGDCWDSPENGDVYVDDLLLAANGRLIDLDWIDVEESVDEWPKKLAALTTDFRIFTPEH